MRALTRLTLVTLRRIIRCPVLPSLIRRVGALAAMDSLLRLIRLTCCVMFVLMSVRLIVMYLSVMNLLYLTACRRLRGVLIVARLGTTYLV